MPDFAPLFNTTDFPTRWALGQEVADDGSKTIIITTEDMETEVLRVVVAGDTKRGTRASVIGEYLVHLHNVALAELKA